MGKHCEAITYLHVPLTIIIIIIIELVIFQIHPSWVFEMIAYFHFVSPTIQCRFKCQQTPFAIWLSFQLRFAFRHLYSFISHHERGNTQYSTTPTPLSFRVVHLMTDSVKCSDLPRLLLKAAVSKQIMLWGLRLSQRGQTERHTMNGKD